MTGKLILIRHQESEWNKLGRWTGHRDIHLTPLGFERSNKFGLYVKNLDIKINQAFASMQVRSIETLSCILNSCELYDISTRHAVELDERDYGDYTGNNKWDMEKLFGKEDFVKLRRSWDTVPPNGESLKMVYDRVVPYYQNEILPLIQKGENILVVGHGNSLRSLVKYIENISDEAIADLEFDFDQMVIFDLDENGKSLSKRVEKVSLD
ncbi:2,3-bisphosphoglycerate-dependent phosphoglycerate mutase [Candidatus Parcubacteria bacterium]|nr:2,3-bisphosphoglycerate-dependent phosphoglycerate mutase [Candidatus Parcubacteria bacterium]